MRSRTRGIATLALALTLPVAACDEGPEFGRVSVQLTDLPSEEITQAWVTITDIYLQGGAGEQDPPGGRVYLLEDGEETHELLELANDVADLVVGQEVPNGSYGQLRLVMSGGCIETGDGVYASSPAYDLCGEPTGVLQMPSFAQSGAKILLNGLQVSGGQQVVLLDFSVEDSYGRAAGASGNWVMNPVIHGATLGLTAGIDVTLGAGEVTLPAGFALGDFSATVEPAEGDSARVDFTDPDQDGVFGVSFVHLIPGNGPFEVRLNAPDGLTVTVDPATPQSVLPASGETPTIDWVLQSVE